MNNKVTVTIYGQEFTVGGDKSAEQIVRIATHVDLKMRQIAGEEYNGPLSSLAILTAMNICEEYFEATNAVEEMKKNTSKLEADGQHYEQMWDEAKKSFLVYKEDSQAEIQALNEQKEALRNMLGEKDREIEEIKKMQKMAEDDARREGEEAASAATQQFKDMENNFFDLQMENIQLKSELEKLRNQRRWESNDRQDF